MSLATTAPAGGQATLPFQEGVFRQTVLRNVTAALLFSFRKANGNADCDGRIFVFLFLVFVLFLVFFWFGKNVQDLPPRMRVF